MLQVTFVCDGHDVHASSVLPQRPIDENEFQTPLAGSQKVRQHVDMYAPHEKDPQRGGRGTGALWEKHRF